MMPLPVAIAIIVAVTALAYFGMYRGWRKRANRDAALVAPLGEVSGDIIGEYTGLYVATTQHESPLNRLAIAHLGFRSKVTITVTTAGIGLVMPGTPTVFIGRRDLVAAGRATWTIDRVVERDGLAFISWRFDAGTIADSYVRLQQSDTAALIASLERVLPTSTATEI